MKILSKLKLFDVWKINQFELTVERLSHQSLVEEISVYSWVLRILNVYICAKESRWIVQHYIARRQIYLQEIAAQKSSEGVSQFEHYYFEDLIAETILVLFY